MACRRSHPAAPEELPVCLADLPTGNRDTDGIRLVRPADGDPAGIAMTKRLFREEDLIVGPSTGAMVHAAVEFGKQCAGLAVAISPDDGFKYTSFFADVLGDEGLPKVG